MTLEEINILSEEEVRKELTRCCGAERWVQGMAEARPFSKQIGLEETSEALWPKLTDADWQEAFRHHPKIGDIESLRAKFADTRTWASGEQGGVSGASDDVLNTLRDGNAEYEAKFGFIFIVCATGKSADEMLGLLQTRLPHTPADELPIAAEEQKKITRLRLHKLLMG